MEHLPQLIIDLALILAIAGVTTLICRKLKQPLILGYILAGFLVGPAIGFVPSVGDAESIQTWSDIGVIFLMFGLGLEFSIIRLASVGKSAVITALVEMVIMIVVGFICGSLLGWSFYTSIFLGGMLAMSSTTIIIKTFGDFGLKKRKFTELVSGALVVEDIVAIFLMVILSTVAVSSNVEGAQMMGQLGQMVLYLIIWVVLGLLLIPTLLQKVAKSLNDEVLLIVAIALCLGMVVLSNAIGFSTALGAFIAGSILAGTVQAHRIEKLFKPVSDLFGAVFFVSVGMLVSPQAIIDNWLAVIIVTIVTLIGKPIASTLGALFAGKSLKTSLEVGLSLSQIGEFSFILAGLGLSLGVTADFLYPIIVAVSVVTTLTTPYYIKSADSVHALLTKILPDSLVKRIDEKAAANTEPKESSLWGNFLKRRFVKFIMVVVAALGSVALLDGLLKPLMLMAIPADIVNLILTAFALIITGIFIANLFQGEKRGEFMQLWMEQRKHHLALVLISALGFIVSAGAVVYIVLSFEEASLWTLIPAVIATFFFARSKGLHSWFLQLETRFVGNLNENILVERNTDNSVEDRIEWTEDHLYVTTVEVTRMTIRAQKPVAVAYFIALSCNLDLIGIKRNGEVLHEDELAHLTKAELRERLRNPEDDMDLIKGDQLTFVGTEEEIDAFLSNMIKASALTEDDAWKETLNEYLLDEPESGDLICFSLKIDSLSKFKGKRIDAIGFREHYGCLVIALERNLLPVVKPHKDTRLAQNDLVLLLGKKEVAEFFKGTSRELLVTPLDIAAPQEETATTSA